MSEEEVIVNPYWQGLEAYEGDPTSDIGRISKAMKLRHAATIDPERSRQLTDEEAAAWKLVADTGR